MDLHGFSLSAGSKSSAHSGTATCITTKGKFYLLTAAHVWKALQGGEFAVSLETERVMLSINREFTEPKIIGPGSGDWGPDLALIRIPDLVARDIQQLKAFYNLDRHRPEPPAIPGAEQSTLWTVLGAPAERSVVGPDDAVLNLTLFDTWEVKTNYTNRFDYHDLRFNRHRRPALPRSYGGISGSGLWQIPLMLNPGRGEIGWSWAIRLAGVAFYQLDRSDDESLIRCHGEKSLEILLAAV